MMAKRSVVITCVTGTFFLLVFYVAYFDDGASTQRYIHTAFSAVVETAVTRQGFNSIVSNAHSESTTLPSNIAEMLEKHINRQSSASATQSNESQSSAKSQSESEHKQPPKVHQIKIKKEKSTITKTGAATNDSTRSLNPRFPTNPSVILYSKYRTGSTFASAFLQKHSQYFFTFEPLHLVDPKLLNKEANYWLAEALNCRFTELHDNWMNSGRYNAGLRHLWKRRTFCFKYNENATCAARDIHDLEADCRAYSYTGTKVILVPYLSNLVPFMDAKVKVVHLVRDPRGVMGSILKAQYGPKANASSAIAKYKSGKGVVLNKLNAYCQELRADLQFIHKHLPNRDFHHLVRYEDLAMDPHTQVERLYKFLGQTPSDGLMSWVDEWSDRAQGESKMTSKRENVYGTYRNNSTETAIGWRKILPFEVIWDVQHRCKDIIRELGYTLFMDESDVNDPTMSVLDHYPSLYDMQ